MNVWAVTRFTSEGDVIVELFATGDLATAFRDGYVTNYEGDCRVKRFRVWTGDE